MGLLAQCQTAYFCVFDAGQDMWLIQCRVYRGLSVACCLHNFARHRVQKPVHPGNSASTAPSQTEEERREVWGGGGGGEETDTEREL